MPLMASPSSQPKEVRPVPAPSNPVLLEAQSQWLFTDEELTRTPSQLDGMSMEAEHTSRSKGVNFIVQVGIMLKLPQPTLATASVYLHRFFMRYSMVDLPNRPGMHPYPIAATSLFLASKMEENCRKMKDFVVACCRVAQKKPDLVVDEQSKEFWKWRDTILHTEDLLLEALCFDLQLEQPYRILYEFICFFGVNDNKPLRNAAWAFVNDSSYTVLCLQFTPRIIAASALYAAARLCNVAFEDDAAGRPWWEQIDVDLSKVRQACNRMVRLYEKNSVHRQSHPYPTVPIEGEAVLETTRIPRPRRDSVTGTSSDGEVNGRKRSREAEEDNTGSRPGSSSHPPEQQSLKNGSSFDSSHHNEEPSPKRQRLSQDSDSKEPKPPPDTHHYNSSQASTSSNLSFSSQPVNGHHPASSSNEYYSSQNSHPSYSKHHHQQHNHHRPYPQPPPPPPPPVSHEAPDPIQQRIDEIVQQGLARNSGNDKPRGDKYRPAWDRDRDRDRDRDWQRERRRSSVTSGSGGGGRDEGGGGQKPSTTTTGSAAGSAAPERGRTQGAAEAGDDEEEGEIKEEEEGEIKEEGEIDADEEGGGSEEGEV
ncbi:hypothetical protein VTN96DRAFT_6757 [Rasamsonia emersonii]